MKIKMRVRRGGKGGLGVEGIDEEERGKRCREDEILNIWKIRIKVRVLVIYYLSCVWVASKLLVKSQDCQIRHALLCTLFC